MSTGTRVEASMSARSNCSASLAGAWVGSDGAFSGISVASILRLQDRHVHRRSRHNYGGVLPGTGSGLPAGDGEATGWGEAGGGTAEDWGEAAGVAAAPGWVPACTAGGLIAAAG